MFYKSDLIKFSEIKVCDCCENVFDLGYYVQFGINKHFICKDCYEILQSIFKDNRQHVILRNKEYL